MGRKRIPITDEIRADIEARLLNNRDIAEKYGIAPSTASVMRRSLRVDDSHKSTFMPVDEEHLLGTMTDTALAERWGCSRWNVCQLRTRRGIAAFTKRIRLSTPEDLETAEAL